MEVLVGALGTIQLVPLCVTLCTLTLLLLKGYCGWANEILELLCKYFAPPTKIANMICTTLYHMVYSSIN